jgi:hypothetical protein
VTAKKRLEILENHVGRASGPTWADMMRARDRLARRTCQWIADWLERRDATNPPPLSSEETVDEEVIRRWNVANDISTGDARFTLIGRLDAIHERMRAGGELISHGRHREAGV